MKLTHHNTFALLMLLYALGWFGVLMTAQAPLIDFCVLCGLPLLGAGLAVWIERVGS